MPTARRRLVAAVLALVAVAGLTTASAARLAVGPAGLGAGGADVVACQPADQPVRVGFTSTHTAGGYVVSAVRLRGIAAGCLGRTLRVTLVGSTAPELVTTVTGADQDVPLPAGVRPAAASITSVALALHD